jgi:hypothetical protein
VDKNTDLGTELWAAKLVGDARLVTMFGAGESGLSWFRVRLYSPRERNCSSRAR